MDSWRCCQSIVRLDIHSRENNCPLYWSFHFAVSPSYWLYSLSCCFVFSFSLVGLNILSYQVIMIWLWSLSHLVGSMCPVITNKQISDATLFQKPVAFLLGSNSSPICTMSIVYWSSWPKHQKLLDHFMDTKEANFWHDTLFHFKGSQEAVLYKPPYLD